MSDSALAVPTKNKGGRPHVSHYEDFLKAYFDPYSKTCGEASKSAKTVGVSSRAAQYMLAKFRKLGPPERMHHAFKELGLDEWVWAAKIKQLINATDKMGQPTAVTVEGTKMLGRALGCVIPDAVQVQQITQNISGGPVMIVVGASDQRFKQLEAGAKEETVIDAEVTEVEPVAADTNHV
mgnify:CR=1 FL=1